MKVKGGTKINGAFNGGDNRIHIGSLFSKKTFCGLFYHQFIISYAEFDVTCPECIEAWLRRSKLPILQENV